MSPYYNLNKQKSHESQRGKMTINTIVGVAILIISFVYLVEVNKTVAQSYQLGEYRGQLNNEMETGRQAEVEVAEQKSMVNLEKAAADMKMVGIDKIDYLSLTKDKVALAGLNL